MPNNMVKKSYWIVGWLALCGILIIAVAAWLGPESPDKNALSDTATTTEELPVPLSPEELAAYNVDMTDKDNPIAVITTNKGVIELELFEDMMPITAGNFKKLANEGAYNGTKFHRIIEGFMIQGGDPNTKGDDVMQYGVGGPGYTIPDEFVKGENLTNVRGTIAMANTGQPNSGGSQFFINLVDNTGLDFDKPPAQSSHPVFGRVVKGMELIDALGKVETGPRDVPLDPVIVEKVEIREAS